MSDFETDRKFELKFIKQVREILAEQFIVRDFIEDTEKGTDFLILSVKPFRIAVRLRRYKFIRYREEFTIRWSRPSGIKTEIDKIKEGLVKYILYGFVDKNEKEVIEYFIGDLDIFRKVYSRPKAIIPNDPYDSELAIYSLNQFPKEFVLKRIQTEDISIEDKLRINPNKTDKNRTIDNFL